MSILKGQLTLKLGTFTGENKQVQKWVYLFLHLYTAYMHVYK